MNGFSRITRYLYKTVKPISAFSNSIGIVALAAMMLITSADVLLRKLVNMPILGSNEIVQYMLAITVSLGFAYCALEKGHIIIDLLTSRLSSNARSTIYCVTGFLSLVLTSIITWQACIYITVLAKTEAVSPILSIPVFPFVGVVAFGFFLLTMVFLINFLEFLDEAMKK